MSSSEANASAPRPTSGWRTLLRLIIAFFAAAGSYLLVLRLFDVLNRGNPPGTLVGDVTGYGIAIMSHLGFGIVLFPLWMWFCYWLTKKIA
jgi:hypothetical protein